MANQGMVQDYVSPTLVGTPVSPADELAQARQEIEILKNSDPFRVVEMALELQVERMRVVEAMNARDATVQRLSDAYNALRQKTAVIEQLQETIKRSASENAPVAERTTDVKDGQMKAKDEEIAGLEKTLKALQEEIRVLKVSAASENANASAKAGTKSPDPPPQYEEAPVKAVNSPFGRELTSQPTTPAVGLNRQLSVIGMAPSRPPQGVPYRISRDTPGSSSSSSSTPPSRPSSRASFAPSPTPIGRCSSVSPQVLDPNQKAQLDDPVELMKMRYVLLEALPIPLSVPQDTVQPITLPSPTSFHEFLASTPGLQPFKTGLANYRVLQSTTTTWCPEREEHGFLYTPLFKCNTNPRVNTAHRWSQVDVLCKMSKPTECFFNKDGTWYYAGVYVGFRMDDLSSKEWAELPQETTQAIIKDTLSGRKNTSPQNVYETSQLYAAGALKVAVVGLQCVGFNQGMYKALLEQAKKVMENHWKQVVAIGRHGLGMGLGMGLGVGTVLNWNAGAGVGGSHGSGMTLGLGGFGGAGVGELVEGIVGMSLNSGNIGHGNTATGSGGAVQEEGDNLSANNRLGGGR
ncbi:hypothetical protein AX16_004155 [Volvariella volvacea WC 439]|nr:hypothetical protein AX16_004155 [Volvariella volvacea WC 439]